MLELFAGAGGLALGLEKAGLSCVMLNELDKWACKTLRFNRPEWNVVEGDVSQQSFKRYKDKMDIVTGGFPCQAFSYAGKKAAIGEAFPSPFKKNTCSKAFTWVAAKPAWPDALAGTSLA